MAKLITPQVGRRLEELKAPWALMLVGLPGSGKTTFIKKLLSYLDDKHVAVLSTDDLIEARAAAEGKTYSEIFGSVSFKVFKTEMEQAGEQARAWKRSVILDQTNMSSKARRTKIEPFVKAGYTCVVLGFDVPMKTLFERIEKRGAETGKVIEHKVLYQMASGYTPPTKDEGFAHVWDYEA